MEDQCYRILAEHLDQLPGGFAPSETGAELQLLKRLFTPEEASLAIHLTLDRDDASAIAGRAALPVSETEQRLNAMAHKGLIFSIHPDQGPVLYQAVPFVVGIYEFQINRMSEGLLDDLAQYWSTQTQRPQVETVPQMRTIPVGESIVPQLEALPYEHVYALVRDQDRFAVAPCICRRHAKMKGGGCDAPEETCLMFGEWADYYVRDGRGRSIARSEVMEILRRADAANLVLQPNNSKDAAFICCCCGCCCGILGGLKRHPKPAEVVVSSFIAKLEPEACLGCWTCLERCQMDAISEDGDRVALNTDRCIGCGLCVSTCPSGALTLVRKSGSEKVHIQETMNDTWRTISKIQTELR